MGKEKAKIGIIGGMSDKSTQDYYQRLNQQVNTVLGGLTTPNLIIYSVDFGEITELMASNNWDALAIKMTEIAKTLENAGANYIAIATNTMHKVADYVQSQIGIPLIHIADCVADSCLSKGITNVGLIGTKITMTEDFLKERLKQNGLSVCTPYSENTINEINRIIFDELCKGILKEESKQYLIKVIYEMVQKQRIDGIIFGCTEIGEIIKQSDLNIPVFDTTQTHVDGIVRKYLEKDLCLTKKG